MSEEEHDFDEMITKFSKAAEKVGLYLQNANVAEPTEEGNPLLPLHLQDKTVVMAVFMVGDRAFADAVQNPEKAETDKMFRDITPDVQDRFLDIRNSIRGDLLGDDDDQ